MYYQLTILLIHAVFLHVSFLRGYQVGEVASCGSCNVAWVWRAVPYVGGALVALGEAVYITMSLFCAECVVWTTTNSC